MLNTVYIRHTRCHFNFVYETLKYEGHDLVIVIEHPLEVGLDSWSNKIVVPLLAHIAAIETSEVLWATRFGGGLGAPLKIGALEPTAGRIDGGWRNRNFASLPSAHIFSADDGFAGTVPDIVSRGEHLLMQRPPYSHR